MSVLKTTPSVRSRKDCGFFGSSSSFPSTSLCCSTELFQSGGSVKNGSEKGSLASTSMSFCESCRCELQPRMHKHPINSNNFTQRAFFIQFHIPHLPCAAQRNML